MYTMKYAIKGNFEFCVQLANPLFKQKQALPRNYPPTIGGNLGTSNVQALLASDPTLRKPWEKAAPPSLWLIYWGQPIFQENKHDGSIDQAVF